MTVYGWGAVEVERACERALALAQELRRYDLKYPPLWGLWSVHFLRGDLGRALEAAEPVLQMAQASGVPMLELTGRHAISFTRYCRGEYEVAIAEADAGLAYYDLDQERILAKTFGLSSAVCLRCSRANSLWMMARHEGVLAPDIWRIRGRLLAREGECSAAEASYRMAAVRARGQNALSLELRAALDLYELLAAEGRAEEGRLQLGGVLERFTQGLDRPDLVRAVAIVGATV